MMQNRGAPLGEGQGVGGSRWSAAERVVIRPGDSGGSHVGAARGLAGNFAGGVMLGCAGNFAGGVMLGCVGG